MSVTAEEVGAVERYLAVVEEVVSLGGNIWEHEKSQTIGRLYLDALSEGRYTMHELLGEVWKLYRKYGFTVKAGGKVVRTEEDD